MTVLASALVDYLAVRRAVGYKLVTDQHELSAFVAHLDANGADTVTVVAAVEWAAATPRGGSGAHRLTMIRGFARYLQALDPAHEVPPPGLLRVRGGRRVPHLYSDADVEALMDAAGSLQPAAWAATVNTIIGLLWVTGMRVGEVLRLNTIDLDVDTAVLTVWLSKFNKSRLVPITACTVAALVDYRAKMPATAADPAMFVTPAGQRVGYQRFHRAFVKLLDHTGTVTNTGVRPRIHDIRHSFAVRTLLGWYRDGVDVNAMMPRLSTYLGHVEPANTYWYLSAAPELMALAAQRLDHLTAGADR